MRTTRLRSAAAGTAFVIGSAAIVLLRQPGVSSWNTMWAEDGSLYAHDALTMPVMRTLFRSYAGYLQLTPRLLALGTRLIPPSWIAPYFAVTVALLTGLLGLMVVHSADGWVTTRGMRWLLGLVVVACPSLAYEVNATAANLSWVMLASSFWVIASRRRGRGETALRAAVLVMAALSTTVMVVMVPFAILVAVVRRTRSDLVVLASLLGALAVQGAIDHYATPIQRNPVYVVADAAKGFAVRVLGSMVVGERWLSTFFPSHSRLLIVGSIVVLAAVVAAARVQRLSFERAWLVGGAAVTAVASYLVPTFIRGSGVIGLLYHGRYDPSGSRYVYPAVFLLFSAVVVLVDGSGRQWLKGIVAAQAVIIVVASLRVGGLRSNGPPWSVGVRQAAATCREHAALAEAAVPISPGGWVVVVPCDRLR